MEYFFSFGQANSLKIHDLVKPKKGFKIYELPKSKLTPAGFSILEPGLIMVAQDGGIMMPSFHSWLITPNFPFIFSADQMIDKKDTAIAIIKADFQKKRLYYQVTNNLQINDSIGSLCKIPYGYYHIRVFSKELVYLWGSDEERKSKIMAIDHNRLMNVYMSNSTIRAFDFVNQSSFLVAEDSTIKLVQANGSSKLIFKMDLPVDGVAVDATGTVYVSTVKGVIHYFSSDPTDFDIITERIHGELRLYRNELFIFWRDKNMFVEIKLI